MQTQLMRPGTAEVPWFEYRSTASDQVERTPVQSVPFSIGRIDTADLQIDSGRVSREHAVVVKEGKAYRIRDLGSTNGTLVNGERIDDVELHDGDIVVIADQEFTFVAADAASTRRVPTQLMGGASTAPNPFDRVMALRRLQESLLHRGFHPSLKQVFELNSGNTLGYASASWGASQRNGKSNWLASPFAAYSSSTWHACQLYRTLAAEAFLDVRQREILIVGIDMEEIEGNDSLLSQLGQLRSLIGDESLVINLPAGVYDVDRHPLLISLKQSGCMTAYGDFVGSRSQVMRLADDPPDYLLLSPTMSRDLHSARQRRQLSSIPDACHEIGCQAVVCGLATPADEDACRDLGFTLAMSRRDSRLGTTSSAQLLAATSH